MSDYKHIHEQILKRDRDSYRDGWNSPWPARIACVVLVLAILVGGMV